MSDNEKQPDPELEKEQREIRQRLIRRVAFAIGLIGVAAISLPLLDKIKSTPENKPAPPPASDAQTTRIISAPGKPAEIEHKPETQVAEPPPATNKEPVQQAPAPTTNTTQTDTEKAEPDTPPKPVVAARPQPITTLPASPKQIERPQPIPPQSGDIRTPSRPQAIAPQHPAEPSPPVKPNEADIPVIPRNKTQTGQGYTVQLGVFSNYANAKALQQRLASNGIKAQLETRVQLGPFKDKQEAEEAYRKIRQLGLPAVLVGQ